METIPQPVSKVRRVRKTKLSKLREYFASEEPRVSFDWSTESCSSTSNISIDNSSEEESFGTFASEVECSSASASEEESPSAFAEDTALPINENVLQSSVLETARAPSPHWTDMFSSIDPECDFIDEETLPDELLHTKVPLYSGSEVGLKNFDALLRAFCLRFRLDDTAGTNLYKVFQMCLPKNNLAPTPHSYVYRMKKRLSLNSNLISFNDGVYCSLFFGDFLKDVAESNWNALVDYADERVRQPVCDIPSHKVCTDFSTTNVNLNLIMFTDGVSVVKSSANNELWPVWMALCELPPLLRMMRENIVLCGLFAGRSKPPWHSIVPELIKQLSMEHHIDIFSRNVILKFQVILMAADSIAKPHLLNMYQHNGFYGCNYCTALGISIDRHHGYYPHDTPFTIRNPDVTEKLLIIAENQEFEGRYENVAGVKGRSAFHDLVPGLPLSCGIDYMHGVLQGVYQELLKLQIKTLAGPLRKLINQEAKDISAPKELIEHGRNVRGHEDISYFKANEFFNYLFFVGVVIMKDRLSTNLYEHYLQLVFGIRILLESNKPEDINEAELMISLFCENYSKLYGNPKLDTLNVHLLQHLAHQVRSFGPLFVFSTMCFESANRLLGKLCSGTHSQCTTICRRYLEWQFLREIDLDDDPVKQLTGQWLNKFKAREPQGCFERDVDENEHVRFARECYVGCKISSRMEVDGTYYDSSCYKRDLKAPNSFVTILKGGKHKLGQILYFVTMPEESQLPFQQYAAIAFFTILESISIPGLTDREWYLRVEKTDQQDLVPLENFEKLLHIQSNNKLWLLKVPKFIDHM